jgi:NADPH:quinone reductase-like Zn-dependent oxidoreductase
MERWSTAHALQVWHGAITRGALKAGETVLITGASGGVGTAAVQICKLLGCRVIAVTSSDTKRPKLLELGADEVTHPQAPAPDHPLLFDVRATPSRWHLVFLRIPAVVVLTGDRRTRR